MVVPELAQARDHLPALAARGGVEPGGGLVEEEQLRVADQADGDLEPPALPAAELRAAGVGPVGQAHHLEGLHHRARAGVVAGVELEHLAGGEVGLDGRLLEHHADAVAPAERRAPRVLAEHPDVAAGAPAVALEDLDGGGLPGAVGAQEGDDLAPPDVEVDAAHRLQRAVGHAQPAHADGAPPGRWAARHRRGRWAPRRPPPCASRRRRRCRRFPCRTMIIVCPPESVAVASPTTLPATARRHNGPEVESGGATPSTRGWTERSQRPRTSTRAPTTPRRAPIILGR